MIITKLKYLFNNNTLFKNTSYLASGIVISQIISIISSPVLTRIYTPEDFGILNIYSSVIAIIGVASALRFELAIPLPQKDTEGFSLFIISIFFVSIITIISALLLFFVKFQFISSLALLGDYLYLIPIGLFFSGIYQTLNYYSIRKNAFGIISKTKILQSGLGISFQILLGLVGFRPLGLLIGSIIKRSSGILWLIKPLKQDLNLITKVSFTQLKALIVKYKKFPLISSQSAIINVLGLSLPVLLLAGYFDAKHVGFFSLTVMVISLPVSTLGKALSQVFFKEAIDLLAMDKTALKHLFFNILKNLFLLGLIPFLTLFAFGPFLFSKIFGLKWLLSGQIAQILSFMYFLQFMAVPTSQLLTILHKQEIQLLWDIFRLITVFFSIFISYKLHVTFIQTMIYFSLGMSMTYCILLAIQFYYLQKKINA